MKALELVAAPPGAVFRIWRVRERVELEAADQFTQLADDLFLLYGSDDSVAHMAASAAADEIRHAGLCRTILGELENSFETDTPTLGTVLGPSSLALRERVLYRCVALSCVTETLSTALLVDMQKKALPGIIRDTVHEILEDEVSHSRLGWAELARAAGRESVAWLGSHIPFMLREAFESDVPGQGNRAEPPADLSGWGILPRQRAKELMLQTVEHVILPGLSQFGIGTLEVGNYARSLLS